MGVPRRTVLVGAAATLAGCSGVTTDGGDSVTDGRPAATTDPGTTTTVDDTTADSCAPADVTRPAVPTGTELDGRPYPQPPAGPTTGSVAQYLGDFERAFAWNRALGEFPDVLGIRVQTLDGFEPVETGDGFRATGLMRLLVVTERADGGRRARRGDYVVSYTLDDGGVYRRETADSGTDAGSNSDGQLVACRRAGEN
jgi:hypothetical protein